MKTENHLLLGFVVMFSALIFVLVAVALFNKNLNFDQVVVLLIVGSIIMIIGFAIMLFPRKKYPYHRL
jgi:ABC-type nickel/cobalt efflux system permease component RcnA